MKQLSKNFLLTALLIAPLVPASVVAQDSYTVTSLGDNGAWDDPDTQDDESIDGVCDDGTGQCTLRAALEEAMNRDHSVTVTFGVNGTIGTAGDLYLPDGSRVLGPNGNVTISSSGGGLSGGDNLTITNLVFSVSAFSTAITVGSNGTITGNTVLSGGAGISSGNANIISNNTIQASGAGLGAGDSNTITGNRVLSGQVGISVVNANVIGGLSSQDRNVIGGCMFGISLGGSDNRVFGNYIGVDTSGNTALPNVVGIIVANSGNMIGGGTPAERNIISGNTIQGIGAAGTNNSIRGNYIGIGANGVVSIPNGIGVKMDGAGIIGGDSPGDRNIISANGNGVSLGKDPDGNSAVILKGNYIGTDVTGTSALGNTGAGVTIGSEGHRIDHNVISSNGTTGIGVLSVAGVSLAVDNIISGNKIGTDASGLNPLPNGVGIIFQGPSNDNIVGEGLLAPYEGNTIAFNTGPGILVDAQQAFGGIPKGNTFRKNSIYDNGNLGIRIQTPAQGGVLPPIIDSLKDGVLYGHGALSDARIDVYEAEPDPSGAGEGKTWLANGTAGAGGLFEVPVTNTNCKQLTITQTDIDRNTSQFSQNLVLDPEVKSLIPDCPQTFLIGVALVNPFTATIDWKGAPEATRSVTFELNGNVHQGNLSGDIATTTFDMGSISQGSNTMIVKAMSCGGTSPDFTYEVCGTTVPAWASVGGPITANGISCDAIYSKPFIFPEPAPIPYMPVISSIPFIEGAMGFVRPQGEVSLRASTAGGTLPNPDVSLNSKFSLAGESFRLTASGSTNTTLACGSLNLNGSLTATVSVSHTYSWGTDLSSLLPATCPSIPVLGELCERARAIANLASVGAEVGGSIGITANYEAGNGVQFTGGSGQGSLFIRPFINVFPFSAEGRGTMAVQVAIPSFDTHGQLSLSFSVSAGPFGSRSYGPYSWPAITPSTVFAEGGKGNFLSDGFQPFNLALRDTTDQDTLIASGIPADAAPTFAIGPNGKRVVAWSQFNANAARPSGDIGLKIFNGIAWGSTIFLNADIQVDQKPAAAFDNAGHVIVCWERNLTTDIPPDTAIYVASYLQGFDIQYSILDANSGAVQDSGTYGDANIYDFSPRLSRGVDGSVLLVYESTSGNTIFGNVSDPASLISVRWNGSAWGALAVVSSSLTGIHSWEAANRSTDTSLVALVLDTDGDLSTSADWELFAGAWNGTAWSSPARLTNDGAVDWGVHAAYIDDGRPALCWLRDSVVVGIIGDLMQQPDVWLGDSANVGLEFVNGMLAAGAGKLLLGWAEVGNIVTSGTNVAPPLWPQPRTRSTEGDERSLSVAVDETGHGLFGYLRVPFGGIGSTLSDTADIYLSTIDLGPIITEVEKGATDIPDAFTLMDAFPNPFNPTTTIAYTIARQEFVQLKVFDVLGREVAALINGVEAPGHKSVVLNAHGLASGVYYYRLQAGDHTQTKKLLLVR